LVALLAISLDLLPCVPLASATAAYPLFEENTTWVFPALQQWAMDMSEQGYTVTINSVGEKASVKGYIGGTITTPSHYFRQAVRASGPSAYPLTTMAFALAQTTGFDPNKGATLVPFLDFVLGQGQLEAKPLGYAPLPTNVISYANNQITKIP